MKGSAPIITCDGDDGFCDEWEIDNYQAAVSTVNGARITSTERAPGWKSTSDDVDLCPRHAKAGE